MQEVEVELLQQDLMVYLDQVDQAEQVQQIQ